MHGATCLDHNDNILRPAILWNDGRSFAQCESMMHEMPSLPKIAGNLAMPGFTAPKLDMPQLFEGNQFTGELKSDIAAELELPIVPIVAGGGDNAAGAIGVGTVEKGDGFLSLGTSGVIFIADKKYRPCPETAVHTFCHALPDLWHQMSVILSAASAIDFVAKITGFKTPGDLYASAEHLKSVNQSLYFLPYLSGERTPHNNPNAKGGFFGLTHEDSRETLAQAALEGVAFALADGFDALKATGVDIKSLSVIGGGARSKHWGKILASSFGTTLHYRDGSTVGPAFGAARLARLALTKEDIETVCKPPKIDFTIEADPTLEDMFSEKRKTFKNLYTHTKDFTL